VNRQQSVKYCHRCPSRLHGQHAQQLLQKADGYEAYPIGLTI
jgi:hypothetical protein